MTDEARLMLMQLVAYCGLIGATIEYLSIVRRREVLRARSAAHVAAMRDAGLQGLVRVFLADV